MVKKVLKKEITDDEMLDLSARIGKMFPDELYFTLGLFIATIMAEMFENAEEVEIDDKPKVTSPDEIYHCGDHTFRVHKKANDAFSIDHFYHGVFKGLKKTESQEEAFKYILAILADHLV